jgi:hypothetical protein
MTTTNGFQLFVVDSNTIDLVPSVLLPALTTQAGQILPMLLLW